MKINFVPFPQPTDFSMVVQAAHNPCPDPDMAIEVDPGFLLRYQKVVSDFLLLQAEINVLMDLKLKSYE